MTARIYGPWPPGTTAVDGGVTVTILTGKQITSANLITTHVFKGNLYWTVFET